MFDVRRFREHFDALVDNDSTPLVREMSRYHFQKPGSCFRPELIYNCSRALGLSEEWALSGSVVLESLHNASLIHDDIQDGTLIRRGQISLCQKYGKAHALNVGDYLLSLSYKSCAKFQVEHVGLILEKVHHCVKNTIYGQMEDIHAKGLDRLSLEDYNRITWLKSGQLMLLCVEIPSIIAKPKGLEIAWAALLKPLILCFQILDDIQDWEEDKQSGNFSIMQVLSDQNKMSQVEANRMALQYFTAAHEQLMKLPVALQWPFVPLFKNLEAQFAGECTI